MSNDTFSRARHAGDILVASLLVLTFAAGIRAAAAAGPEATRALERDPTLDYAPDAVLLKFAPTASAAERRSARALVGGGKARGYGIVTALEKLSLGPRMPVEQAVEVLQRLPFVDYVEPDYVRRAATDDTYYGLQWSLENTGQEVNGTAGTADADIDAEEAWTVTTGDPALVVAVIDTGIEYTHPDLAANAWVNPGETANDGVDNDGNGYVDDVHGWDFYQNDADPMDDDGHGTHVAGTVCAHGNNGEGVSGVAWRCRLMALRFLGPNGGYTSDAIAALDYALAHGVMISNNSWGSGGYSQSLHDAIASAGAAGHLFVAAAGNESADTDATPYYPAAFGLDNVVSVAATDSSDGLADFSNFGATSVDVAAPGVDIASTMLGNYYYANGTSMAAPHVTGVAALVLGSHPGWTHVELRNRILGTARAVPALDGLTATGGVVNAYQAVLEASAPPAAPSDLAATAVSDERIDLGWSDNADAEEGFVVERSLDGASWSEVASTARDATGYSDTGLDTETTYQYRVYAFNSAGSSGPSNTASATTEPVPTYQEVLASSETTTAGSVTGVYPDTWYDDGQAESITERESGGRPKSRYSYLQHTWAFEVPPGSSSFHLNAWSNDSSDGDGFRFSYSLDGSTFEEMLVVSGGDGTQEYGYPFPPDSSGTVYVRVTDTDRTPGNRSRDTVTIDRMHIRSDSEPGLPPATPEGLTAAASSGRIDLGWSDRATDELGFEVERTADDGVTWSVVATLAADAQAWADESVAAETTYGYRVRAYNGAGYSEYSNEASTSTPAGADLALSATGYKHKRWQYVDLAWTPDVGVDLYRDDALIASDVSGGTYTDERVGKRGGSYTYLACEAGSQTVCSDPVEVNF